MHLTTRLYLRLRRLFYEFALAWPRRVECNVCGWRGRRFMSDQWHPHTYCPKCQSQVRHRLLLATLRTRDDLGADQIAKGKAVLHFAPEAFLSSTVRQVAARYVTADYLRDDVDLMLDISSMPTVKDGEFDLLIACDVLEHVPDDAAALREIHRVLRDGGTAVLSVPQPDNFPTTFEDPAVVDPKQREELFGQWDHLRLYGEDFVTRVVNAEFQVTTITAADFERTLVEKYVLEPPILSRAKNATNKRRIYFARKQQVA